MALPQGTKLTNGKKEGIPGSEEKCLPFDSNSDSQLPKFSDSELSKIADSRLRFLGITCELRLSYNSKEASTN